jgi:hypothetical protein
MTTNEDRRLNAVEFHKRNPQVWDLFVRFANEKISVGFKHYSARGIWHRIRWETPAGDDGVEKFKLGDHHAKFYARRFMKMYPSYDGFFRQRDNSKITAEIASLVDDYHDD